MASSGDDNVSGSVTEEFDYEHTCLPCETEGKMKRAVGYCINCREYLCQRCYDGHLVPSQTKRHILLDEEHLSDKETVEAVQDKSSERCPNHPEEIINFHCPTHSFFGCYICFYTHQKDCKLVLYIPEVSKNIVGSEEYQDFSNRVTGITDKASQLLVDIQTATEVNSTCHKNAVTRIKAFKKELLDAVDKLEKELLEKAEKVHEEKITELSTLTEKANAILSENQILTSKIEILLNKQHNCDLYTTMIQLKDTLLVLDDGLHAAVSNTPTVRYDYKRNNELLKTLKRPYGLGEICQIGTITELEYSRTINCKTENDPSYCHLVGSVFLEEHTLVLADQYNHKVKLVDTRQNRVVADIKVSPDPWGICKVTDTQVAVATHSEQKIVFVEVKASLSIDRELKVDGSCRGVGYTEGKLVVSFDSPNKVEIIDLKGTLLKKIETDNDGKSLFNYPYHLAVNPYNKLIYVSNYNSYDVVCMTFSGAVVGKYTDSELQYPWQVTTDMIGNVYVCGKSSNNVHQLTEGCIRMSVFLTKTKGLKGPESIAYNEKDDEIYIGQTSNDLKVFKVILKSL